MLFTLRVYKMFTNEKFRNNLKNKYFNRLNTSKLSFPVALNQIEPFARQNKLTINVNGYTRKHVYPMIMMRRDTKFKLVCCGHHKTFFYKINLKRIIELISVV